MEQKIGIDQNIIFLDVDGVLNCELFYEQIRETGATFIENHFCEERVSLLNQLCKDINVRVVISSTWRMGRTIDELRDIFREAGADFNILGATPILRESYTVRGNEIKKWIDDNVADIERLYHRYAIIDDDSDMLYWQRNNFFQTDGYSGLTPNICYKIKRFFQQKDL